MPSLFANEKTHPFVLMAYLSKKYGHEWMEWPPPVLRQTLEKDEEVDPSPLTIQKILATAAVATRDDFWKSWEVFHFVSQALAGYRPVVDDLQEQSVADLMVAVDIAMHIRKQVSKVVDVPEFSEEVARYIAAQALFQGIWYLPEPLEFANEYTAKKWYRCKDCGTEAEVVFDDGLCDVCTDRFSLSHLGGWIEDHDKIEKGKGTNITVFEKNPIEPVKKRLAEVEKNPNLQLKENQVDTCVSKILRALAVRDAWRKEMAEGLKEIS